MTDYTQGRAQFASTALLYLAIAFGTLSFWTDALAAGDPLTATVDWMVAAFLTVAMLAVSYLLSGVVLRYADAREKKATVTARLVVILGGVLVLIEGGMTHQGLAWLDARKDLGPEWAMWVASFGLSGLNVFALYTFARDIPKPKADAHRVSPPFTEESPATAAGRSLALHRHQNAA